MAIVADNDAIVNSTGRKTMSPIQKAIRALTSSEPLPPKARAEIVIELDRLSIGTKTPAILADALALAETENAKFRKALEELLVGWSVDDLNGHGGAMDLQVTGVAVASALRALGR